MKLEYWEVCFIAACAALLMFISGLCVGSTIGFGDGVKAAVQITGVCK